MNFKVWVEQFETMLISSLIMTKEELSQAIDNISRGYPSQTEGPVEVVYRTEMQPERYQLVQGYHRMVEAIVRGETEIQVMKLNEDTSKWMVPKPNDLFQFDWDLPYRGLENFIEPYMLRRL